MALSCSALLGSFSTMALAKPVGPTIQSCPEGSERMLGSDTSRVLSTRVALKWKPGAKLADIGPLDPGAPAVVVVEEPKQPARSRSAAAAGRRMRMAAATG